MRAYYLLQDAVAVSNPATTKGKPVNSPNKTFQLVVEGDAATQVTVKAKIQVSNDGKHWKDQLAEITVIKASGTETSNAGFFPADTEMWAMVRAIITSFTGAGKAHVMMGI